MSTHRAFRLSLLAASLLLVGGGRSAAADSYPFEIRLSNSVFGEKVFTGEITPEDGSFEIFTTSGSTRIHMTGSIAGDHVHVYGELIIPGAASWQRFKPFSADGTFSAEGTVKQGIVAYPFNGTPARGTITVKRPVTAIAATPPVQPVAPTQPATPSTPTTTQSTPPAQTQTAVVTPPAPDEPTLTNSERVEVQQQLSVLGFYKSNVDGDFGPGTRKAIKSFQRANRLEATGYLTETTIATLAEKASVREQQLAEQRAAEQEAAAQQLAAQQQAAQQQAAQQQAAHQQAAQQQAQQQAAQQQLDQQQAAQQQAAQQNAGADFTAQDQSAAQLEHRTPETPASPAPPATEDFSAAIA